MSLARTFAGLTGALLGALSLDAGFGTSGALAQSTSMPSEVEVLHGWRADDTHFAGLQIRLDQGWKTYWRVPGSGGIPPQISFEGSINLAEAEVGYPNPTVFWDYGMRSLGYMQEVTFPLRLTTQNPGQPVTLRYQIDYGVCAEVCIPAQAAGEIALSPAPGAGVATIQAALARLPQSSGDHGLTPATCDLRAGAQGMVIEAALPAPSSMERVPDAVIEAGSDMIWVADPDVEHHDGALRIRAEMHYFGEGTATLVRDRMRFTLIGADHAIEFRGCEAG